MNNNGTAEWRGGFEDCALVYCAIPDEFGRDATAIAEPISHGNPPNISALEDIIKSIPPDKKKLGIFYENAQMLYRCNKGHSFGASLKFKLTCKLFPREFGQARWEPIENACTRMRLNTYLNATRYIHDTY